jgi:hypothetical protein
VSSCGCVEVWRLCEELLASGLVRGGREEIRSVGCEGVNLKGNEEERVMIMMVRCVVCDFCAGLW